MGYCVNCDNRHGCKTGTPLCHTPSLKRMNRDNIAGKKLMEKLGKLGMCLECVYFQSCWIKDEFNRKVSINKDVTDSN